MAGNVSGITGNNYCINKSNRNETPKDADDNKQIWYFEHRGLDEHNETPKDADDDLKRVIERVEESGKTFGQIASEGIAKMMNVYHEAVIALDMPVSPLNQTVVSVSNIQTDESLPKVHEAVTELLKKSLDIDSHYNNQQTNNEPEEQTEANDIKEYDEYVKNFGNKNFSEEDHIKMSWLATKYGFISPAAELDEKDKGSVENYNALMHKYYETKKLNLDETVEVNRISQKYNTLLPVDLKSIVPDDSIRSLGFIKYFLE